MTGRVIRTRGRTFTVLCDGKEYPCEAFAKIKQERGPTVVAVGDVVDFTTAVDGPGGIERVHPRKTKFSRPKIGEEHSEQVIVSNIDQMVIITSVAQPKFKPHLIDRFMVSAFKGGLQPAVVINKIDLKHHLDLDRTQRIYESLGVQVIWTSAADGRGIDQLRTILKDHESIFVGHSGTGKSSLLNQLRPNLGLRVAEISESTAKGRHTTTTVELFYLESGGYVVDSPGLKILGLWDIDRDELQSYFPEFEPLLGQCKFSRCSHLHEPDCAVRQSVNEDRIFPERFESYEKIYRTL